MAHQHGVEEGGLIHRRAPAADESRGRAAAELFGVCADRGNEFAVECADRTGDAVQDIAFQRRPRVAADIGLISVDHEFCESVDGVCGVCIGHGELLSKTVGALRLSSVANSMRRHMSADMVGISLSPNQRASRLSSSATNGSPPVQSIRNTWSRYCA